MDREPRHISKSKPVMEGAGVHLKRAFGFGDTDNTDPFLLLDDFSGRHKEDYMAGFPWHPHRGIETITYLLKGSVEHQDSMGNKGIIGAGDVQWMTAGRGIVHQEMPIAPDDEIMEGFQLWANLPAAKKMMKPRYQEVKNLEIPEKVLADGSRIRVICGAFQGTVGPVEDIITEPDYFDVTLAPGADISHPIAPGKNAFAYVIAGSGRFGEGAIVDKESLVYFSDGDRVRLRNPDRDHPFRFLLCSGLAIGEPVAWHGPIVMNTQAEIKQAFRELQDGSFIR